VSRFTVAARALSQFGRTRSFAGLMEKIMSKTNDPLKLDRVKIETRVLADSELDAVSGGWSLNGIPGATDPPAQTTPWNWKRMMDDPFSLK
jgi:hypothetical protein